MQGLVRKLKEGDHLGNMGLDDSMILQYMLKKQVWRAWTGFICLKMKPIEGFYGNVIMNLQIL
jgi:hypothetical protein